VSLTQPLAERCRRQRGYVNALVMFQSLVEDPDR
jgi:hypothetical protein